MPDASNATFHRRTLRCSTVGCPNGPLAPMYTFFEVAVFDCTVNEAVRFGRLRINGEDEELGPPAMQQVGDRAG